MAEAERLAGSVKNLSECLALLEGWLASVGLYDLDSVDGLSFEQRTEAVLSILLSENHPMRMRHEFPFY